LGIIILHGDRSLSYTDSGFITCGIFQSMAANGAAVDLTVLQQQMQQLMQEIQNVRAENQNLQQAQVQAQAAAQASAAQAAIQLQQAQAQAAAATQAAANAAAQAAAAAGPPRQNAVVDTRGIGKPATFDPKHNTVDEAKFNSWAFKVTNYINASVMHARTLMKWSLERGMDIDGAQLHAECQAEGIADEEGDVVQRQLYALLVSITEGEAATIVENAGEDNGLEAWRRLTKRFDPNNAGRKRAILDTILALPRVKMNELQNAIENMKKLITQYETKHKKKLDDDIKQTVVRGLVPEHLRKHLEMNSSRFMDSDDMLEEIAGYIQSQPDSAAMDIGWLGKGKDGKGKDKGWHDKGKGKGYFDKGKGKSGGKDFGGKGSGKGDKGKLNLKAQFQGYCDVCKKWGHKKSDCWSAGNGKGKGDKGGGKHKGGYNNNNRNNWQGRQPMQLGQLNDNSILPPVPPVPVHLQQAQVQPQQQAQQQAVQPGVRMLTNGQQQLGFSSLTLFNLGGGSTSRTSIGACENGAGGSLGYFGDNFEEIEVCVDSGASVSALPKNQCTDYPLLPTVASEAGRFYWSAKGEKVYDEGAKVPRCISAEGDFYDMNFSSCDVRRALGSVSGMVHKGKKVVFDLDDGTFDRNGVLSCGSYIEDKASGKRTQMQEKDGNFVVTMKVIPYRDLRSFGQAEQLAPLAQGSASSSGEVRSSPFRRRVPWP
jgi:hypothetical protein